MRDVTSLKGLRTVKTLRSTKKRSIPRVQSSAFLELYMLEKERERLLKENNKLCMRKEAIEKRLKEISLAMDELQEVKASLKAGRSTDFYGEKKEWKKMSLSY